MKRAKKSKAGILILAVLFCLAVVAGAGAFFLRGTGVFSGGAGYLSNPKEEAVCAETKALVLYVSNTEFQVGEEKTVRVTVFADGSLDGEVSVLDDQGIELCKLENDKSGCLEGEISIKKEEPGVGKLFAVSGDEKSAPVSFYVTPVVTEEMVTELLAITKELGDYAFEEGLSAPLDADGRKAVQEWLKKDERV